MATFFNPINFVIVLLIVGAVLALAILVLWGIVRWIRRGSSEAEKPD